MVLLERSSLHKYFRSYLILAEMLNFSAPGKCLSNQRFKQKSRNISMAIIKSLILMAEWPLAAEHSFTSMPAETWSVWSTVSLNFLLCFFVKFTGMAISVNTIHCSVEWFWTWTAVSSFKEYYNKAKDTEQNGGQPFFRSLQFIFSPGAGVRYILPCQ